MEEPEDIVISLEQKSSEERQADALEKIAQSTSSIEWYLSQIVERLSQGIQTYD